MAQQRLKNLTLVCLILAILLVLFAGRSWNPREERVDYHRFWSDYSEHKIWEIKISERELKWRVDGQNEKIFICSAAIDQGDIAKFRDLEINVKNPRNKDQVLKRPLVSFEYRNENPWLLSIVSSWLPFLILILIWFYFLQKMQGGGAKALSFGKSRARFLDNSKVTTTFQDVAGCDEAKADLEEVIDFLKYPKKFTEIGARIPRGVLLMGPPGTGKTLLARAVAGEAKVPFLHISGSDFVEMFVGVGASRVRDLFEQGKKNAPCLLFIDEIDAVGRHRGAGLGGGHDEREQTLNQLLVEMDGFDTNEGVIMIAATNRPDILDPALLRPGRFDRQIVVDLPDLKGREGVFKVHTKKIPLANDVDILVLTQATPGFSGADIANVVNEAALLAARRNRKEVTQMDFEDARDKVLMGPERKTRVLSEKVKLRIAIHESGHCLVNKLVGKSDAVHKVSIIPRGRALGVTSYLPAEDNLYIRDQEYMKETLCSLLGGRVAEELKFKMVSSGASDDLQKATKIAHQMVCEFGMSDRMGPLSYGENAGLVFLGRDLTRDRTYSEQTAREIDEEVKGFVMEAYNETRKLLEANFQILERLAVTLLRHEVLDSKQVDRVIAGEVLPPPIEIKPPAGETAGRTRDPRNEEETEYDTLVGKREPTPAPT